MERVQFEDDEYYYFVKAVPKVFVARRDKRVKRITPKSEGPQAAENWPKSWILTRICWNKEGMENKKEIETKKIIENRKGMKK